MFTIKGAILSEFQFFLDIAPVFACCVIASFAFTALKSYQFHYCFFARHNKPLKYAGAKPRSFMNDLW